MMLALVTLLTILLAGANPAPSASSQSPAPARAPALRFVTLPIHLDPQGQPLAAYQLELRDAAGAATIVGIEGGDHPAFAQPPHYDPRALQHDRIILAAFTTLPAERLPTQSTRIATLHLAVDARRSPEWSLQLTVAADPAGQPIAAHVELGREGTP